MWEEVALEYNSRKARSWLERDFDSLRRKFRNLGQDDAHLLRDVADVLNEDDGGVEDEVSVLNEDEQDTSDPVSNGGREDEEDSQVVVVDFRQRADGEDDADASSTVAPIATGAVVTRRGTFDASLADEVWSEDDEEDEVRQPDDATLTSPPDDSADGSAAGSVDAGLQCTADSEDGYQTQQLTTSTPP
ncbi:hypothetical protein PR001_g32377, partial [Phytophthora rubi]